ncbi:hypothetical protein [Methylomicrobium lacus]|uniref:hypothetical protein n=1 Tax=Methylomicrobium lacus TaxID=136992 RepID=UPI0035A844A3
MEARLFRCKAPHDFQTCQVLKIWQVFSILHATGIAEIPSLGFRQKQAKTSTGLKVTVEVLAGVYETGKNAPRIFSKTSGSFLINIFLVGIIGLFRSGFREVIFEPILNRP